MLESILTRAQGLFTQPGSNTHYLDLEKALRELGAVSTYFEFRQTQNKAQKADSVLARIQSIQIYQTLLTRYEKNQSPAARVLRIAIHQEIADSILNLAETLRDTEIDPGLFIRAHQVVSTLHNMAFGSFFIEPDTPDLEKRFYQDQNDSLRKLAHHHFQQAQLLRQETILDASQAPQAQAYLEKLSKRHQNLSQKSEVFLQLKQREASTFQRDLDRNISTAAALFFFAQGFLQTPGSIHARGLGGVVQLGRRLWHSFSYSGLQMMAFHSASRTLQSNFRELHETLRHPVLSTAQKAGHAATDFALTAFDAGIVLLTAGLLSQRIEILKNFGWSAQEWGKLGLTFLAGSVLSAGAQEIHHSTESFLEGVIDQGQASWNFNFRRLWQALPAVMWASAKAVLISQAVKFVAKPPQGPIAPSAPHGAMMPRSGNQMSLSSQGYLGTQALNPWVLLEEIQRETPSSKLRPKPTKKVELDAPKNPRARQYWTIFQEFKMMESQLVTDYKNKHLLESMLLRLVFEDLKIPGGSYEGFLAHPYYKKYQSKLRDGRFRRNMLEGLLLFIDEPEELARLLSQTSKSLEIKTHKLGLVYQNYLQSFSHFSESQEDREVRMEEMSWFLVYRFFTKEHQEDLPQFEAYTDLAITGLIFQIRDFTQPRHPLYKQMYQAIRQSLKEENRMRFDALPHEDKDEIIKNAVLEVQYRSIEDAEILHRFLYEGSNILTHEAVQLAIKEAKQKLENNVYFRLGGMISTSIKHDIRRQVSKIVADSEAELDQMVEEIGHSQVTDFDEYEKNLTQISLILGNFRGKITPENYLEKVPPRQKIAYLVEKVATQVLDPQKSYDVLALARGERVSRYLSFLISQKILEILKNPSKPIHSWDDLMQAVNSW